MGYIFSIINNKGGVGKTTLAINLSHALANTGKKILLVDLDSQCNGTSTFSGCAQVKNTLYELLDDDKIPLESVIYRTEYKNIDFLPNKADTAALEPDLARREDYGWLLLQERLGDHVREKYDIIILDCPPNLGTFSIQAMIFADFVLVPVEAGSRYATDGLARTIETIEDISATKNLGETAKFLKLIINKADRRTAISKISIEQIKRQYLNKVCQTIIPINTDIQQAELLGRTVIRHASKSPGAKAFRGLAKELIGIISDGESIGKG